MQIRGSADLKILSMMLKKENFLKKHHIVSAPDGLIDEFLKKLKTNNE